MRICMHRKSFLLAGASALAAGCARQPTSTRRYQEIAQDGEPLKSAFNRDAGRVRILMLVSPT